MSRAASRFLVVAMSALLATGWLAARPRAVAAATPTELFFSEYIEGSSNNKALEIYNGTGSTIDLGAGAYNVQMFFNGNPAAGLTINLTGTALATGDVYVLAHSSAGPDILAQADQTNGAGWFNGDDAVVLRKGTTVIDSLGQAGFDPGTEWGSGLASTADNTLRRMATVCGGDSNPLDAFAPAAQWDGFATDTFTGLGGHTAACDDNINLAVNDVSKSEGSGSQLYDFTVSLSNPAGPGGVTFDIATQDNTATTTDNDYIAQSLVGQEIPEGQSTYLFSVIVNGNSTFELNETFFVNVTNVSGATGVVDGQGGGTIVNDDPEACGDPGVTLISQIQGAGATTPIPGTSVAVEAVVVGDYQGSGQFGGYFLQEQDGDSDADPATSEGLFVFSSSPVNSGDHVRVRGTASEFSGQTQISSVTSTVVCSAGNSVTSASLTFPVSAVTDLEAYEGMQISVAQELTVTEVFTLARFGEVALSVGGRLDNPTNEVAPGAPALALQDLNDRSRILLDDGNNQQNIDPTLYPQGGLSASNTLRVGDTLPSLVGVLDFRFSAYRVQPLAPVEFTHSNPRPAAPDVGGDVQVAAFNVLNYFNGNGSGLDGMPGGFPTARGATSLPEFNRQRDKTISAITALDADVVGLMELENDDTDAEFGAIEDLVAGLNDATAPGTWSFIDTGVVGTDAIRVGLLYQTASVTPVGDFAIIDSTVDERFIDTLNRPSLLQTFSTMSGTRYSVLVNHLKSKGSDCNDVGDPDGADGQGNCNGTRTLAAEAIVDWLATDPTGSGDPDVIVIGDLNSYAMEDPITVFRDAGYVDTIDERLDGEGYSYVFQGQSGYLDHALASPSLAAQITGVSDWHINADEPVALDYNVEFKSPAQIISFYADDAYRSSDHDPVLVGLDLTSDAPTIAISAGLSCTADGGGSFAITIGDTDNAAGDLTLSLTGNSNSTLVPNGNVSFGGAGANRTVAISAASKQGGTALLTIGVSDGTTTTTVTISVQIGTDADETLDGSAGSDLIVGEQGIDTLNGNDGADVLCGSNGNDTLSGGEGADALDGGSGIDTLLGDAGDDVLRGGLGNDSLTGGEDADAFSGGAGADTNTDFDADEGDTSDGT